MGELKQFLRFDLELIFLSVLLSSLSLSLTISFSLYLPLFHRGPDRFKELSQLLGVPDDMVVGFVVGE